MFRSILFDMDDTLINTMVAKFATHKHNAKTFYNLELSDEDIAAHLCTIGDQRCSPGASNCHQYHPLHKPHTMLIHYFTGPRTLT